MVKNSGRRHLWLDRADRAGKRTLFNCISRLYGAGSMVFDGRSLASFVRYLASLGIAQDCFKRPALI